MQVWHVRFERFVGKRRTAICYWPTPLVLALSASAVRPCDLNYSYDSCTLRLTKLYAGLNAGELFTETREDWQWPEPTTGEADALYLVSGPPPLQPDAIVAIAAGHAETQWLSQADQLVVDQCSALFSLLFKDAAEVVDTMC